MPNSHMNSTDHYETLKRFLPISEKIQKITLGHIKKNIARILYELGAKRVLDIGCGTGGLGAYLKKYGIEAVGVDRSPTMITRANKQQSYSKLLIGDAQYLSSLLGISTVFDAAILSFSLHEMNVEIQEKAWNEICSYVKHGGIMVVTDISVPKKFTLLARLMKLFIDRDERRIGKVYPLHYKNYLDFIKNGGVSVWIHAYKLKIIRERCYYAENICTIAVQNE